jgi:hypothetical protein
MSEFSKAEQGLIDGPLIIAGEAELPVGPSEGKAMRSILSLDQTQLKQVEAKLAELTALPIADQARKQCLIEALRRERTELQRYCRRADRQRQLAA